MKKLIIRIQFIISILLAINGIIVAQNYIPADPHSLLFIEKSIFLDNNSHSSPMIKPFFRPLKSKNKWSLKIRSEFFYNSSVPNLENMSDRWVGKGIGFFNSLNIAYRNKYLIFSAEPYYFIDQNDDYIEPNRLSGFSRLNDNRPHIKSPYISYGVRELQVYAQYKGIGAGYSNANMWWGLGIHSSIMMTNNTSGFGYAFLGTVGEKKYKNIGINARYIFSKFDKKSLYKPYFSAFAISLSYYSDNIYTIGVTKTALTGGTHPTADNVSWEDGALAVFFSGIRPKNYTPEIRREVWSSDDHAGAGYFSIDIKKSLLKLFFEIGRNDLFGTSRESLVYFDHAIATNIGMRKYGLFKIEQLFFGIEYANLLLPRLFGGDWYVREQYDHSSYNGRMWVAHSGPDSDDLLIIMGWLNDDAAIIPSFNIERHGLRQPTSQQISDFSVDKLYDIWPETKLEFRLDLRYKYKKYKLNLYFEREITLNLESKDKTNKGYVIWMGIERDIGKEFFH